MELEWWGLRGRVGEGDGEDEDIGIEIRSWTGREEVAVGGRAEEEEWVYISMFPCTFFLLCIENVRIVRTSVYKHCDVHHKFIAKSKYIPNTPNQSNSLLLPSVMDLPSFSCLALVRIFRLGRLIRSDQYQYQINIISKFAVLLFPIEVPKSNHISVGPSAQND